MKTNNSDITIPNGEKIKGNNLLSKYVSKKLICLYFNEIEFEYSIIFLFQWTLVIQSCTNNSYLIAI